MARSIFATFYRGDEVPISVAAADGAALVRPAVELLAACSPLQDGDTLVVHYTDDEPPAELPEVSRASQHSS